MSDYLDSGFDQFLSRSIDNFSQANLDAPGPQTNAIAYDRAQMSGSLGNTFRIGNISLDGVAGNISLDDSGNPIVSFGNTDDGDGLYLFDGNGNQILDISNRSSSTGIRMKDGKGNDMVYLGRDEKNNFNLLFKDSSSFKRLLMGQYPDNTIKIKLSQPNISVDTATDDQLIWSSDFNMFKIIQSGSTSLTVTDPLTAGATSTATIAHNLGYPPTFLAFVTVPVGWSGSNANQLTALPTMLIDGDAGIAGGGAAIYLYVQAAVDNTNLYLKVTNPATAAQTGFGNPWTFRYYIIKETAATT